MTKAILKGVHKMNPTRAVMKTYTASFIKATTSNNPGYKRNKTAAEAIKQLKGNKK
mgnify:CR=1 FL=1